MTYVFISYIRENSVIVQRLVDELRGAGIKVWLDRDSISPGCLWQDAIKEAIEQGGFFLACFSKEYQNRQTTFMNEELAIAFDLLIKHNFGRNWFIPLRINQCSIQDMPINATRSLHSIQILDFSSDWLEGMRQLLSVLEPERSFGHFRKLSLNSKSTEIKKTKDHSCVIALDFGTTYSTIAFYKDGKGFEAIPDELGRTIIPSVITFTDGWDYFVGHDAVFVSHQTPNKAVFNVKRGIGENTDISIGHKRFSTDLIASLIIKYLKENAEQFLGVKIYEIIVAVPANFSNAQRAALIKICENCGLIVKRVVPEPNAAGILALEWHQKRIESGAPYSGVVSVLNVDVGGGTTDISVIDLDSNDGVLEVKSIAGDNKLGGIDYDDALFSYIYTKEIKPLIHSGLIWTENDNHRLMQTLSQAKILLEKNEQVILNLGTCEFGDTGMRDIHCTLSITEMKKICCELDKRVEILLDEALNKDDRIDAYGKIRIDAILFAGQGCKIPTIENLIRKKFEGIQIISSFQEKAVVNGLGLLSGVLAGKNKNFLLLDIIPWAILVKFNLQPKSEDIISLSHDEEENTVNIPNVISPISAQNQPIEVITKGETFPTRKSLDFFVQESGDLILDIYDGKMNNNKRLNLISKLEVGRVQKYDIIRVAIDVDANSTILTEVLKSQKEIGNERNLNNKHLYEDDVIMSLESDEKKSESLNVQEKVNGREDSDALNFLRLIMDNSQESSNKPLEDHNHNNSEVASFLSAVLDDSPKSQLGNYGIFKTVLRKQINNLQKI